MSSLAGVNSYNEQFTPACNLHDWCYGGAARPLSAGAVGDWLYRKPCDDAFYQRMLATCGTDTSCRLWARDYYDAVRAFGDSILVGYPYTSGQRDGQHNLLPNVSRSSCTGCSAGVAAPVIHINVRGSNTTYWKLDTGAWRRVNCPAWDPNHTACTGDVTLQPVPGSHIVRIKAVDYYTGAIGHTWAVASWTS